MKLEPPLLGLSEDRSLAEQEPGTTRECFNSRAEDPPSGREMPAQRSGMTDFSTNLDAVSGANPVRFAGDITYSIPVLDYAEVSNANLQGASEWLYTEKSRDAREVVVDSENATYWLFGKDTLTKLSSDGELVWCFSIPLEEETHVARGLCVDDARNIYLGSAANQDYSDGSFDAIAVDAVNENCKVWRLSQIAKPEDDTEEVRVTAEWGAGGFVEDIYVRPGNPYLYYLQNRPDRYEADLVIVRDFGVNSSAISAQPRQLATRIVPYPANSLAVNAVGEVVVASEPFNQRSIDPKYPGLSRTSNIAKLPGMWTHRRNLANADGRRWCEVDASALGQANGTAVTNLPDLDGYGRGWFFASSLSGDLRTFTEPTYIERALGDAAGVRFDGVDTGLQSSPNQSLDYRDRGGAQRTPWPSYGSHSGGVTDDTCAQYAIFLVVRVPRLAAKGAIIGQHSEVADYPVTTVHGQCIYALVANRPEDISTTPTAEAGKLTLYDSVRVAAGNFQSNYPPAGIEESGGQTRFPREADLLGIRAAPNDSADPEEPPIALVTIIVDNAVDPGGSKTGKTRCVYRVNGRPIDRWEGSIRISLEPVTLGFAADFGGTTLGTNHGIFAGDFIRYLCIARPDPLDITQPTVLSHQFTSPRARAFNILSTATAGNFTVTVHYPDGTADETTAPLGFGATAAQVEAALEALPGLGGGSPSPDVSVSGTAVNVGGGVNVFFGWNEATAQPTDTGEYYGIDLPIFTINDSTTGGTVTASTVAAIDAGLAGTTLAHQVLKDQELELIEGEIAHNLGIHHLFPQPGEPFEHPFATFPPLDPDAVDPTDLTSTDGIIAKFSTGDMSLVWVEASASGIGYDVTLDEDDDVYSLGPSGWKKYTDAGDSVTLADSGTFTPAGFGDRHPRSVVDSLKTWYIPRWPTSSTSMSTVVAIDDAGSTELLYDSSATEANRVPGRAVAVASPVPTYPASPAITRSEYLFVASSVAPVGAGPDDVNTARKVRLVTATHNGGPARATRRVVVSNGDVKRDDGAGGYVAVTGGTGALDAACPFVTGARFKEKLYLNDQARIYVYDPKEDELTLLKASDGGEVPQRAHFVFEWGGHFGAARLDDNPAFVKLARAGHPDQWNTTPNPLYPGRPWKGAASPDIGDTPDIINSVAPVSESLLVFFGDHSLNMLQGKPTFGGQLTNVAHQVGGAYGKCWAWDKAERLFFMSNFGEIYMLPIGGKPECISDRRIKRSLQSIDFSTHYVYAEWNWLDDTVHFFLIPYGSATEVTHYVLDTKRGRLGFWPDTFDVTRQPTCVGTFNGDAAGDRRMVVGHPDGHLRVWDPNADDDDGKAIDWRLLYTLNPSGMDTRVGAGSLEVVLEHTQDGCFAEFVPAEHAGLLLEDYASPAMPLRAGFNPPSPVQSEGNYLYLRFRNSAVGSRSAIQEAKLDLSPSGPRRPVLAL